MKIDEVFRTRDNKTFNSRQSAKDHCYGQATTQLTTLFKSINLDNPYAFAKKIIMACIESNSNDLGEAYYNLFEAVNYLKDSHIIEKE